MKKLVFASITLLCSLAVAQEAAKTTPKHSTTKPAAKTESMKAKNAFAPDEIQWGPAPPFIPAGASLAVLEGNPMGTTGDYTIRLKMPDGYKIAPHWHPKRENVTVISGTLRWGWAISLMKAK